MDDFEILTKNPKINTIYFEGNPVSKHPGYRAKINELIKEIDMIDGIPAKSKPR